MKILIIEDDRVDRASLKRDLRNTNLVSEIIEADTGLTGIEIFRQSSFDCILLDYNLPDMEGYDVLQELINIRSELLSVIVITGDSGEKLSERMLEGGASDYLIKDEINTRSLERALRFTLKRKQFQESSERKLRELAQKLEISNKNLEELAHHDPLTKLLNRRGTESILERAIKSASRNMQELVVILVDLDNFKEINDRFAHTSGDIVLQEVANVLKSTLRPSDYVARIGGDEFLFLITVSSFNEATKVAERIRMAIKSVKVESRGEIIEITSSIGVSKVSMKTVTMSDLISQSEHALHQSKNSGKDFVSYSIDGMALPKSPEDNEKRIIRALSKVSDFTVAKQAIYSLSSEKIIGYEFLSRGPKSISENPDDFFRMSLEKNILSLVDQICFKGCMSATNYMDTNLIFHINLFPSTLLELSASRLLELLPGKHTRSSYCIEISEQQVIGDPSYLKKNISVFQDAGVKIALDDIGFGRSCLESLIFLEPNIVKIDKKRIIGISKSSEKRDELKRLIRILRSIKTKIVAEGIECREDLEVLIDFGIKYGQGFLWGKPLLTRIN